MQEKSQIKQKILQYLDYKGVSTYKFYKDSGITRGILTQPSGISEDNLAKFLKWATDVNKGWLLGDDPEMIVLELIENTVEEPRIPYDEGKRKKKIEGIPLMPIEAFAGLSNNRDYSISLNAIEDRYVIPLFNGKGVDFLIYVRGNSMYPKYNSGDVVACKFVKERLFIQWNKVYIIDTQSQGTLMKRLIKSDVSECITCKSDNQDYGTFDVPLSDIRNMALVVGVIRLE